MELERQSTPFDSIRCVDDQGEHWFARELMPLMGYEQWRRFNDVINRAKVSMANEGTDTRLHFSQVSQLVSSGNLGQQERLDFRLTRHACYRIAMNGDVKKRQIALAQQYFVIRTMQAEQIEKTPAAPEPSPEMPTHIEALRGWANALEAQQKAEEAARVAEAEVRELRPPAEAWRALAAAGGDCSVAEAAAILNRDPGITIGSTRLFRWLEEIGIVYRRASRQLVPYQRHMDHVRLRSTTSGTEVRITPDGLVWIQQRLRQEQSRPALASVPNQVSAAPMRPET